MLTVLSRGETPSNLPSFPAEATDPASHTYHSHAPTANNTNPNPPPPPPPPYARYSRSPPASDNKIPDSTYIESPTYMETSRDPSYRRPVPPSQPISQSDFVPRNVGITPGQEPLPRMGQHQPHNPTLAAAPSPYPPNITTTGPFDPSLSRLHSSSAQATLWLKNAGNGTYPPVFSESHSNIGAPPEGISREQCLDPQNSGWCGLTREAPRNFHDLYGHEASGHLRHAASYAGLSISSSNLNHQALSRSSTVTSHRWHSPDSIHAYHPNNSTTTLRSDAPTLVSQPPTPAGFDMGSTLSLATACEPVSPVLDDSVRSTLATRHSLSTCVTASPASPAPYPTEPFDSWRAEDNLSAPRSLAPRPHSEASNPALLFGSAFWGSSASHDYDAITHPTMQTTGSQGAFNPGVMHEIDSIPVYKNGQQTGQSRYAELPEQNNKSAASISSYEVSYPYSPTDGVELP